MCVPPPPLTPLASTRVPPLAKPSPARWLPLRRRMPTIKLAHFSVQPEPFFSLEPPQVKYGEFIHGLKEENIDMNRKMLSELAMNEPYSFKALVDQAWGLLRTGPQPTWRRRGFINAHHVKRLGIDEC